MVELFEEASDMGDKDKDLTLPFFSVAKLRSKVHMAGLPTPWVQSIVCARDWTANCKKTIEVRLIASVISNAPHYDVQGYITLYI